MLANSFKKNNLYVRPECVIFSAEICILQTRIYWKVGTSRNWNEVFEIQNWNILTDRAQRVDGKNGVIRLVILTPRIMVIKMSKMAHFMYFLLYTAKYQSQFGQDFKCIWKVLFGPSRKCYGLYTSELPLAKFQCLKTQDFGIPLFTQKSFCLSTISQKQLSPKPINHTIFCNNSILSSLCT